MSRLSLEFHLERAAQSGNRKFIEFIGDLRWRLYLAIRSEDWKEYNALARQLNEHGASISFHYIPPEFPEELTQMGMFDPIRYLTGTGDSFASAGDIFWIHNAKDNGFTKIGREDKPQVKLLVSHERDGDKEVVYTSGAAIVNQIKRMDASDRARFPMEVRLDQLPSKQGSPTNILTPADQPPPSGGGAENFAATSGVDDF